MDDTSLPLQGAPIEGSEVSKESWLSRLFKRGLTSRRPASQSQTTQSKAREKMMIAADRFHVLRVEDVMVPRADIVAVDVSTGLHDVSLAFKDAGHSRLPVYKDSLDDPVGMVHIKDLLSYLMLNARGRSGQTYKDRKVIPNIKRQVLFVPPSMLTQDLLRRMQARRIHMAMMRKMMLIRWAGLSLHWRGAFQNAVRSYTIMAGWNLK